MSEYLFVNKLNTLSRSLLRNDILSYHELSQMNNNLPQMIYEYVEWYYSEYYENKKLLETSSWAPRYFEDPKDEYSNKLSHNLFQTFYEFIDKHPNYISVYKYIDTIDSTSEIFERLFSTIGNLMYLNENNSIEYSNSDIVQMYFINN